MRKQATQVKELERSAEADLLLRVAGGPVAALGALYDAFAASILRFASRVAGKDEAEDIVQTVFERVLAIAPSFDPAVGSARPWLFGVATRVALERKRSMRRFAAALLTLSAQARPATENSGEARSDLERTLARLTPVKRAVLVLTEAEGFSCEEVAQMLKIPVGTVWTRLHHARRELRRFQEKER
jgi:RNA polymerase sigma-70 factor (ECF subfamily)